MSSKIEELFLNTDPIRRDLLRNLESRDIVLLDGDSLMCLALDDASLERRYGGQLLHAVYAVEKTIFAFLERKVNVQVVFFSRNACLWSFSPFATLLRRVLIAVLSQQSRVPVWTSFSDAASRRWLAKVRDQTYVFAGVFQYAPGLAPSALHKTLLEAQSLTFLTWVRTACLQDLSWSDATAFGFLTQQSFAPITQLRPLLRAAYEELGGAYDSDDEDAIADLAENDDAPLPEFEDDEIDSDDQELVDELNAIIARAKEANMPVPSRSGLVAMVASSLLRVEHPSLDRRVVYAWTLAVESASALPLHLRSALYPAPAEQYPAVVASSIQLIHRAAAALLEQLVKGLDPDAAAATADLVDGRWLHVVLSLLTSSDADLVRNDETLFAWTSACKQVELDNAAPKDIDGIPPLASEEVGPEPIVQADDVKNAVVVPAASALDAVPDIALFNTPEKPIKANMGEYTPDGESVTELLPVAKELGGVLCGDDAIAHIPFLDARAGKAATADAVRSAIDFVRSQHWQPCAYILPEASNRLLVKKEEASLARMRQKQRERQRQKFLAFQQQYATSLEGTTALAGKRTGPITGSIEAASHAATVADAERGDNPAPAAHKQPKTKKPTKADLIRAENARKRKTEEQRRQLDTWNNFKQTLSTNTTQARKEMLDFAKSRDTDGVRALVYEHMIERLTDQRRHNAASHAKQLRIIIQLVDACKMVATLTRRAILKQWLTNRAESAKEDAQKKSKKGKKGAAVEESDDFVLPETCAGVSSELLADAAATAADTLRQLGFDWKWMLVDEASEDELMHAGMEPYDAERAAAAKDKKKGAGDDTWRMAPPKTSLHYLMPASVKRARSLAAKGGDGALGVEETKESDLLNFQLSHMGHLMERGGPPNAHDSRVAFTPDRWQRTLLDVVDRRASAVVSAPTSSGKTFISYFCMKTVAVDISRPDGTVVFVAPTKALVNQVAAQVYYTFGDRFGVLTGDYRHNVEGCRFLVTVAESLAVLLRSAESVSWTKRIRYAIFDEAHFIGSGEEGAAWEACFTMVQCPFLALSATIGNPEELRLWMQRVQDTKRARVEASKEDVDYSFEVVTVPSKADGVIHRHADLQKFIYLPDALENKEWYAGREGLAEEAAALYDAAMKREDKIAAIEGPFVGFDQPRDADALDHQRLLRAKALAPLHPLAAATALPTASTETSSALLPRRLTLSPPEVVELFDALVKAVTDTPSSDQDALLKMLGTLRPTKVLGRGFVSRAQVREYENQLQQLLRDMLDGKHGESGRTAAGTVLRRMRVDVDTRTRDLESQYMDQVRAAAKAGAEAASHHPSSTKFLEAHVMTLLVALERSDKLPVIVFTETSNGCERLCEAVVVALERLEIAREGEVNAVKAAKAEKKADKARKKAMDAAAKKSKVGNKKEDGERDDPNDQAADAAADMMDGAQEAAAQHIAPAFSFVRATQSTLTPNGVDNLISHAVGRSKLLTPDSVLVRGLRRGVGVHHTMAEKKYREAVELLFRSRYMQVVFATASLAYGIHMPCRSVVFAGDALSLTALDYNQMAGRAGRRGYDLIGNVVFFGVPLQRVRALVSADVPSLSGMAPRCSSLALRAALLRCANADDTAEQAGTRRLASLMSTSLRAPFFGHQSEERVKQLRERCCFALDAISRRNGLLMADGTPLPLSGLAVFLSESELSAVLLVRLLRSNLLHDVAYQGRGRSTDMAHVALLHVMTMLFYRHPLSVVHRQIAQRLLDSESAISKEFAEKRLPVGRVAQPPLPNAIANVVTDYDLDLLREGADWARFAAQRLGPTGPATLPLTGVTFDGSERLAALRAKMEAVPAVVPVRSPFAALSRRSDRFLSARELKAAARTDLAVDCSGFVDEFTPTDARGRTIPLNAFASDFYRHGTATSVIRANGMADGEVWHNLMDVQRFLEILHVGLEFHTAESAPRDTVFITLDSLLKQFRHRADQIWG